MASTCCRLRRLCAGRHRRFVGHRIRLLQHPTPTREPSRLPHGQERPSPLYHRGASRTVARSAWKSRASARPADPVAPSVTSASGATPRMQHASPAGRRWARYAEKNWGARARLGEPASSKGAFGVRRSRRLQRSHFSTPGHGVQAKRNNVLSPDVLCAPPEPVPSKCGSRMAFEKSIRANLCAASPLGTPTAAPRYRRHRAVNLDPPPRLVTRSAATKSCSCNCR